MSDIKNFERNNYFYGKLMTVRDFETEQSYFIEKQRLINRLIHGAGVVCGLKVEEVVGDTTKIKIKPGVAIDCCGRDIIVPEEKVVDLKDEYRLEETDKVYVLLKYDFCEKESVPVITNASACEETCCCNRILETYKIEISKEPPEDCVPSDDGLCDDWPNLSRVSAKTGPVHFERIMPKLVKKGEVFKVTVKVKAKEDLVSFKIEDTLPSDLELYEDSPSFEREDIKKGETIYHTYWVKAKKIGGFGIKGGIGWKKIIDGLAIANTNPLPGSLLETTETPDEEKAKSFVDYWIEGCPECPEDPAVVLAAITLQKRESSFEIAEIDNAIINEEGFEKSFVFSNPRLYELIKCVEKKAGLEKDLTCIKDISWVHDEEYDFFNETEHAKFLDKLENLTITFDRTINTSTINQKTLNLTEIAYSFGDIETYGYVEQPVKKRDLPLHIIPVIWKNRVCFTFIPPGSIENLRNALATFTIGDAIGAIYSNKTMQLNATQEINTGFRLLIQLKGDFVLDDGDNPVDANHLKGELPTGNGTPGGLFESWFDLKIDFSRVDRVIKEIRINRDRGISGENLAENTETSEKTMELLLPALINNKVIYSKNGLFYTHPNPVRTIVVYDGKDYLRYSAERLKAGLWENGISAKITSLDELTADDRENHEIILVRSKTIVSNIEDKMPELISSLEWAVISDGATEIVANPYIEDANVFIVGGKEKNAVDKAVSGFLKNYTITERTG